jgi:hypothetical protein
MNFSTVPPWALEDRPHPLVVAAHRAPKRLGIGGCAESGRAGQVAEDDGDGLSHLARRGRAGERRAAAGAERKPLRALTAADRTAHARDCIARAAG